MTATITRLVDVNFDHDEDDDDLAPSNHEERAIQIEGERSAVAPTRKNESDKFNDLPPPLTKVPTRSAAKTNVATGSPSATTPALHH